MHIICKIAALIIQGVCQISFLYYVIDDYIASVHELFDKSS